MRAECSAASGAFQAVSGRKVVAEADSGFARDASMSWCEANGADYLFGLSRNKRLEVEVADDLACAGAESRRAGEPRRRFRDFMWRTRKGWSRARRVVIWNECDSFFKGSC